MHLLQLSQSSGWYIYIKNTCITCIYFVLHYQVPEIPIDTRFIRHRVYVFEQTANTFMKQFVTRQVRYSVNLDRKFSVVIHSLVKNSTYKIQIRTEVKGLCVHLRGNSGFLVGRRSLVQVKTAEESKFVHFPIGPICLQINNDYNDSYIIQFCVCTCIIINTRVCPIL